MRIKFIIGAASSALALLCFSNSAQAQSTVGSRLGGNADAVLTIDRGTGSPLEATTTDPLAILGLQSHSATPSDVLVMEGDMVRTYPFATVSGTSTMTGPDADGNYTHTGADRTCLPGHQFIGRNGPRLRNLHPQRWCRRTDNNDL